MIILYIVGIVFALLGLGLHIRTLAWVLDPERFNEFTLNWMTAPITNQFLSVGAMIFPFIFYAICLTMLYVKHKRIIFTVVAFATGMLAIPFYLEVNQHIPLIAKNALYTAASCYPIYWLKTTRNMNDLELNNSNGDNTDHVFD